VSGGLSIKGTPWGRPNDTIGIAGAVNWISADFATYLANGGLGIMIGDGALTYGSEAVAETYYSLQVAKGLFVTAGLPVPRQSRLQRRARPGCTCSADG